VGQCSGRGEVGRLTNSNAVPWVQEIWCFRSLSARAQEAAPQRPWRIEERGGEERWSTLVSLPLGRVRVGDTSKDYGHVLWQLRRAHKRQRQCPQARTDNSAERQRARTRRELTRCAQRGGGGKGTAGQRRAAAGYGRPWPGQGRPGQPSVARSTTPGGPQGDRARQGRQPRQMFVHEF
jgi:hypothetical protein